MAYLFNKTLYSWKREIVLDARALESKANLLFISLMPISKDFYLRDITISWMGAISEKGPTAHTDNIITSPIDFRVGVIPSKAYWGNYVNDYEAYMGSLGALISRSTLNITSLPSSSDRIDGTANFTSEDDVVFKRYVLNQSLNLNKSIEEVVTSISAPSQTFLNDMHLGLEVKQKGSPVTTPNQNINLSVLIWGFDNINPKTTTLGGLQSDQFLI